MRVHHCHTVLAAFAWLAVAGRAGAAGAAPSTGAAAARQECLGCHTAKRGEPPSRFAIGLGAWPDRACHGCHAEIDHLAGELRAGRSDRRLLGLPVRDQRLREMDRRPLPYLNAPEDPGFLRAGTARIAAERLGAFLRRPARSGPAAEHPDGMVAFPGLDEAAARRLARSFGAAARAIPRASDADRARAQATWTSACAACHGGPDAPAGRSAAYLALFTPEWIQRYAAGGASETRKMPTFTLDASTARGLYDLFGRERARLEAALDREVAEGLAQKVQASAGAPAQRPLPAPAIDYLWGRFLRDGGCVHCHDGDLRARAAFASTPAGLADYVRRKGGLELYRRLETRSFEERAGLTAARPGMPMTRPALPVELRQLVLRWALAGCPDPAGTTLCAQRGS